jgi:tryptophan synthase alpha chain
MSRIADRFQKLAGKGGKGFIPFVTAGDPDLETSLAILFKLADLGADVIELGVPFSDPMADGPTIQRSSQRALLNGVTLSDVLELARRFRDANETPLVLFSYLNPLLSYGFESLCRDAATPVSMEFLSPMRSMKKLLSSHDSSSIRDSISFRSSHRLRPTSVSSA